MSEAAAALAEHLRVQLGGKVVVTEPALIDPWLTDWRGRYHGAAAAMLEPRTTAQVATIVRAAMAARVPLVPQGGNTSMVGGATPSADGAALILSMRRMDAIRAVDRDADLIIAEAGVVLQRVHESAAAIGRRFPLTLGARGSATVGGLISTNAGGTQVLRFGSMRALVAGIEAVMPDGLVHDGLSALKKDSRGYDLKELLIGAEGTLGVVTAAALRLVPAVRSRAVAWAAVGTPRDALALLRAFDRESDAIESFEIMPRFSLDLVVAHLGDARLPLATPSPWHLLIEAVATHADDEEPAALLERVLAAATEAGLVRDAVLAQNETQAQAFWRLRDSISAAERAHGPAVQHDISVPVAVMPRFMEEAAARCEARFCGTTAGGFGHLGDGNVHFHVRAPAGIDAAAWYEQDAPEISRFVHDLVVAQGGSIAAEHGIGQMKRDELERLSSPSRLAALRAIKQALDPAGIMNPGKLVTLAPPPPAA